MNKIGEVGQIKNIIRIVAKVIIEPLFDHFGLNACDSAGDFATCGMSENCCWLHFSPRYCVIVNLTTAKAAIAERSQLEIEQFLEMLRFENRKKLGELPAILK